MNEDMPMADICEDCKHRVKAKNVGEDICVLDLEIGIEFYSDGSNYCSEFEPRLD